MKTDRKIPKPPKRSGRGNWKLQEYCSSCDAKDTTAERTLPSIQMVKGEEVQCEVPKYQCSACEATFMSPAQATAGVKIAVAIYQGKHGLLTAEMIKDARRVNDISSAEKFAELVDSLSSATLKRIETGVHVQSQAVDIAIRQAIKELEGDAESWLHISHRITSFVQTESKASFYPKSKKLTKRPSFRIRGINTALGCRDYKNYNTEEACPC